MASNLLIDIGNSAIKWRLDAKDFYQDITDFDLTKIGKYDGTWISCVANHRLLDNFKNANIISPKPYKNLKFNYDLNKLGSDRYLAIISAYEAYKDDVLIVDIGTAITIDLVINNTHLGGLIAPGIKSLRGSFLKFKTDDMDFLDSKLAQNTKDAWKIGTKEMFISYIMLMIKNFKSKYKNIKVLITGGNANLISFDDIIYKKNMVLDGLQIIANEAKRK